MRSRFHHIILLLLLTTACKQSYIPPVIAHPPSYLVVEGFIENNATDPTVFHLSRTVKLDSNSYTPETGATIAIEDSLQNSYPLSEGQSGTYYLAPHTFPDNTSYRIHIHTAAGKEYASAYVPIVRNPPIDSITFARVQTDASDGVYVYANTHDPQNNTRYYRWQYEETWQFHSAFEQEVVYLPSGLVVAAIGLNNYICWHSDSSTAIVLHSTTQLAQDVVFQAPIVFIPNGTQQMTIKYSILVKQIALTKDAFAWWQTLQKNTEQIGSIFGVQPSANPGNIHCITDTAEQVLGYVSGGNTNIQRIFISHDQILPWRYVTDCVDVRVPGNKIKDYIAMGYLLWNNGSPADPDSHMAYKTCVDCTLTGVNQKPSFWAMRTRTHYIIGFLLLATACKQTYMPPIVAHPPNDLVVEGFIETNGTDPTAFTLSRTVKLDSNTYTPEAGATVTIEDSLQNKYPLIENTPGTYSYPAHLFNSNTSYRLRISTTGGKDYASDFFPLVPNPDIDSITWSRVQTSARNGMQIYANTHDPQNTAQYFRFEYQETWEFHSAFEQTIKYIPGTGIVGNVPITDYVCWHYNNSSDIILASSVQLSQDSIFHAPVVFIPDGAQQLSVRYSILVKQYALTKEAFAWWQILQKNTEQIGSIFGVQPSANPGNIHCITDTAEQVLGYVSGCNSHSQRIFITKAQSEPWDYSSGCVDMKIDASAFQSAFNQGYLPWYQEPNGGPVHYSTNTCVDCTLTGTNAKPIFW